MRVWIVEDLDHGGVDVYAENTDITQVPWVERELGYLQNSPYEDEYNDFMAALDAGREACIEERVRATLENVRTLDG